VHEIVRGQGALLAKGWKPLRTVLIASWDGEEHGLVGSTEWVEDFATTIFERVVAYLNIDSAGAGTRYGANASPSLAGLMKAASQEIQHPNDPTRSAFSPAAGPNSIN
jgi:N-acetylated-alpha-linked acidic dipeptidase